MVGSSIGPYRILKRLGSGATGQVYLADDTRLRRRVALKNRPDLARGELADARRRVLREARAAARLNHPNIAAVYDVLETEEGVHIVMEYVPGQTLAALVRSGPLAPATVLEIALQLTDALAEAHAMGVLHRDLKPANVMMTPRGKVKVLDFGLAKSQAVEMGSAPFDASLETGEGQGLVGTHAYMPPEHLTGRPVDAQGDIYSLGVLLFELLTGGRPYQAPSRAALTAAILTEPTPRAGARSGSVPPGLDAAVFRAMARRPSERYASASDMAADVKRVMSAIVDMPTTSGTGERAAPRARAARIGAAVVAAGALALLAVVAGPLLRHGPPNERRSIAVLPLKNISSEPDNEYFSDGITEDIIAQLSKVGELRVISGSSVMAYKDRRKDRRQIARELGVATLLDGSVRRAGNRVRIVSQLVDARTEEQLWAETYDREVQDILAIQSDVSQAIATALKGELSAAEKGRLARRPPADFEVFNLYLKGRYYWSLRTEESLGKSIEYFEAAAARDPAYAPAYAGLADAFNVMGSRGMIPAALGRSRARAAAMKALALDDTLADAHASLALAQHQDLEWAAAEAGYRRAIALNPSYATAHHWLAVYLSQVARSDEAIAEIKRAQSLDPLSVGITSAAGGILFMARQYDRAIEQLGTALEMDPDFALTHQLLAEVYAQTGNHERALAELDRARGLARGRRLALLAYIQAGSGRAGDARAALRELERSPPGDHAYPTDIAAVHCRLGDREAAFRWLEKALGERDMSLAYLKVEPRFDPLRQDARYATLLNRLRLGV
jgi:serine/threonine-protein kinase